MRILHVVPLVTPTGAYGGPITVAINQAKSLQERGHDVEIAGAASGFSSSIPRDINGIRAHLFAATNLIPRSGFAGIYSHGLYRWFSSSRRSFDAVHFHLSRSLTTLPLTRLARKSRTPYVTQTHGMIDASSNLLARPLDALLTRRALEDAQARFYLTQRERADLREVIGGETQLTFLPNGVPRPALTGWEDRAKPGTVDVLFLARLQKRKRPGIFVEAGLQLSAEVPEARFSLVGPDEGEGKYVTHLLEQASSSVTSSHVSWDGPLPPNATMERISRADVYVLPSVDEPFPMSVLEALSLGKPVVITDSCGLAEQVGKAGAGIVVDDSLESLVSAVRSLLTDSELRRRMGAAALELARTEFSMEAVSTALEDAYTAKRNFSQEL